MKCGEAMVLDGTYYHSHGARYGRRAVQEGAGRSRTRRRTLQLAVCLAVTAVLAAVRLLLPGAMEKLSGSLGRVISGSVDYQAAFRALGQGVSGETAWTDALTRACSYAFGIQEEDVQVFSDRDREEDRPDSPTDTETAAAAAPEKDGAQKEAAGAGLSGPLVSEYTFMENTGQVLPLAQEETQEREQEEKVAAFLERQEAYAGLAVPESVTYDAPALALACVRPLEGTVTSRFGYREHPGSGEVRFHYGVDIGAAEGTEVAAFAGGTVTGVGENDAMGLYVVIRHDGGAVTQYAHCSRVLVHTGDTVQAGEPVAEVGQSGNATGPCLHFMLLIDGIYVNPEYYVTWQ